MDKAKNFWDLLPQWMRIGLIVCATCVLLLMISGSFYSLLILVLWLFGFSRGGKNDEETVIKEREQLARSKEGVDREAQKKVEAERTALSSYQKATQEKQANDDLRIEREVQTGSVEKEKAKYNQDIDEILR